MKRVLLLLAIAACTASEASPPDASCAGDGKCDGAAGPQAISITTAYGVVRGTSSSGVASWKGIPYAAPPVGSLRFASPASPSPWSGVRDATRFGSDCLQSDGSGAEDCLYLNVWAPDGAAAAQLPVIVFVHGGDWVLGSGRLAAYDGATVAKRANAVVVTINYRLGASGFLAHAALAAVDPHHSTGNYGLLDQRAALQWVQANIAAFGGDPARVTLWGQSAGAWSVLMHMASPQSRGLFARAFAQSGGSYAQPLAQAEQTGDAFARAAGCTSSDVVACLRALPASRLAAAAPGAGFWDPVIDGWMLTEPVLTTFANGAESNVPLLLGTTLTEFSYPGMGANPPIDHVTDEASYAAAIASNFGNANAPAVLAQYPSSAYGSPGAAYLAALDDGWMTCSARRIARTIVGAPGTQHVYRYVYIHTDDSGPLRAYGAGHFMDVPFWFGTFASQGFTPTIAERALSATMIGYLGRFAATGDPNGAGALAWPRYAPSTDPALALGEQMATYHGFRSTQCDFWDAR